MLFRNPLYLEARDFLGPPQEALLITLEEPFEIWAWATVVVPLDIPRQDEHEVQEAQRLLAEQADRHSTELREFYDKCRDQGGNEYVDEAGEEELRERQREEWEELQGRLPPPEQAPLLGNGTLDGHAVLPQCAVFSVTHVAANATKVPLMEGNMQGGDHDLIAMADLLERSAGKDAVSLMWPAMRAISPKSMFAVQEDLTAFRGTMTRVGDCAEGARNAISLRAEASAERSTTALLVAHEAEGFRSDQPVGGRNHVAQTSSGEGERGGGATTRGRGGKGGGAGRPAGGASGSGPSSRPKKDTPVKPAPVAASLRKGSSPTAGKERGQRDGRKNDARSKKKERDGDVERAAVEEDRVFKKQAGANMSRLADSGEGMETSVGRMAVMLDKVAAGMFPQAGPADGAVPATPVHAAPSLAAVGAAPPLQAPAFDQEAVVQAVIAQITPGLVQGVIAAIIPTLQNLVQNGRGGGPVLPLVPPTDTAVDRAAMGGSSPHVEPGAHADEDEMDV